MKDVLKEIKQKSLDMNIPIIMDDTLDVIEKELKVNKPLRILEIGTATRIFSNLLFKIFKG